MSISPLGAGDGRPWHNSFSTDTAILALSGVANSAIALHLVDMATGVLYVCTGAWTITNIGSVGPPLVPATADFTPSPTDLLSTNPLGKPGLYRVYPVVTLSTGPVPMDAQMLQVIAKP